MARAFSSEDHRAGLTLLVRPIDDPERPVDAEQFLQTATKWLASLASFAADSGLNIRWEIAELKRSSALLEVIPVDIRTGIIADSVAKEWKRVVKDIETSGVSPSSVSATTISDMAKFTTAANELTVLVSSGDEATTQQISVNTQKRLKEAVDSIPSEDYTQFGTVRGKLAVLNSWNPDERWFRLKLPLAPEKQVRCVYSSEDLISHLGGTFERLVDVTGLLHYKKSDIWPFLIEVQSVFQLLPTSLSDFLTQVQPIPLPLGQDSVSSIRSLRDAE